MNSDTPTTLISKRPTVDALTSIRGFAAAWVVLYHFFNEWRILFPQLGALERLAIHGDTAVDLFFALSGFVLAYNYIDQFKILKLRSYLKFLFLRVARIYPVHLVSLLAVLAMFLVAQDARHQLTLEGYTPLQFAQNLLMIQAWVPHLVLNWNYPSWSISSEWFAYLLCPFLCFLLSKATTQVTIGIHVSFAIVLAIGSAWYQGRGLPFDPLVRICGSFWMGCVLFRYGQFWQPGKLTCGLATWLVAAASLMVVLFLRSPMYALALMYPIFIFLLACRENRSMRLLKWRSFIYLGEISYSIYMTHTIVQKLLYVLLPTAQYASSSVAVKLGVLTTYVALILIAAMVMYHVVEVPGRDWLRSVGKRLVSRTG